MSTLTAALVTAVSKINKRKEVPEPMKLMLRRIEMVLDKHPEWYPLPYKALAVDKQLTSHAAEAFGQVNNSDPFAERRMAHYISKGYENASRVLRDSQATLLKRQSENAKRGEAMLRLIQDAA